MRLAQFFPRAAATARLGVLDGDRLIEVTALERRWAERTGLRGARLEGVLAHGLPDDIADFLALGVPARKRLEVLLDWAAAGGGGDLEAASVDAADVSFAPPLSPSSTVYGVGLNYAAHAAEGGAAPAAYPELFIRGSDSLVGHREALVRPSVSPQLDYEGELAVVIGVPCHRVAPDEARRYVAGYTCFNDGSVRDYQKRATLLTPGKNFARSGSMGPWLVTRDEVDDPHRLRVETRIGDEVLQSASTKEMIFDTDVLVSYISEFALLQPGDVIATGTPSGVGFRRTPQRFLVPGDRVVVDIGGLGPLENTVVDERSA